MEDTQQVNWQWGTIPKATKKALDFLSEQSWLKKSKWYLAGGTALALQAGHRKSVDLDFFLPQANFKIGTVLSHFEDTDWETQIAQESTIYGVLHGAKVSFIAYPFFTYTQGPLWYKHVRVLDARDIAVMKIVAISQRGRKRDFYDLYWYLKNKEPLDEILFRLPAQYPTVAHDFHHILKSLVYFKDADEDPEPQIFFDASWRGVKQFFIKQVDGVSKQVLLLLG